MSKVGWFVLAILVGNAVLVSWIAWQKHARSRALDTTTDGVVVAVSGGTGKAPTRHVVARFTVAEQSYTATGSTEDSELDVGLHPGSPVRVYYDSRDPRTAALARDAGFGLWAGLAGGLWALCLAVSYVGFVKRR